MTRNPVIRPLTADRWDDFARLFGKNGACAGCWCMWWRLPRAQWVEQKGDGNKKAIRKIVVDGEVPGLLAGFKEVARRSPTRPIMRCTA
jgi:hypothetical protein